jgi:hypothetical protein
MSTKDGRTIRGFDHQTTVGRPSKRVSGMYLGGAKENQHQKGRET